MKKIGIPYPKGGLLKEKLYLLYAQEASKLGIEIIFFSKESVDWETKTIRGYVFDTGRWRIKQSSFPLQLIVKDEKLLAEANELLGDSKIVPFPDGRLLGGNKWTIYEEFQEEQFQNDLVPSTKIKSSGHFFRILKEYRNLIIKATFGEIPYVVEQKGIRYFLMGGGERIEKSHAELRQFIIELQKQEQHIVQPHLLCRTNDGEVFDLEVNLQKNEHNQWVINNIFPRYYLRKHQYIDVQNIESFLKRNFSGNSIQTLRNLQNYTFNFLQRLDDEYKTVGEFSLYIKIDDLHNFWVDEIQWKLDEVDLVRNHLKNSLLLTEKGNLNDN